MGSLASWYFLCELVPWSVVFAKVLSRFGVPKGLYRFLGCFNPSPGSAVAQPLGWVNLACGAGEEAQCSPGYVPSHLAIVLRNCWFRELCVWWGRGAGRPASKNKMLSKICHMNSLPTRLGSSRTPWVRRTLRMVGRGTRRVSCFKE